MMDLFILLMNLSINFIETDVNKAGNRLQAAVGVFSISKWLNNINFFKILHQDVDCSKMLN